MVCINNGVVPGNLHKTKDTLFPGGWGGALEEASVRIDIVPTGAFCI
jgi:hypothetical protein